MRDIYIVVVLELRFILFSDPTLERTIVPERIRHASDKHDS